jgi:hypothetical protein
MITLQSQLNDQSDRLDTHAELLSNILGRLRALEESGASSQEHSDLASEIHPCPFCGSKAVWSLITLSPSTQAFSVGCDCGARMIADSEDEARRLWNIRTTKLEAAC